MTNKALTVGVAVIAVVVITLCIILAGPTVYQRIRAAQAARRAELEKTVSDRVWYIRTAEFAFATLKGHAPTLRELQGSEFGVDLPPVTFWSDNELLCEGFHYSVLGGDWGVTVGAWPHQADGKTPAFICTDSWQQGGSPNLRRIEDGNKPLEFEGVN